MSSLEGKCALVTGASRGIGAAITRHLAREGVAMAIGYERSADAAAALAGEIEVDGGRAFAVQMDAADATSIKQAVDRAADELGGLDILVNNAGIWRAAAVDQLTLDDIDTTLAVNIRGVILATLPIAVMIAAGIAILFLVKKSSGAGRANGLIQEPATATAPAGPSA